MQARPVHARKRLAQLQHQRLLGLVHGKKTLIADHDEHQSHKSKHQGIFAHYFFSSVLGEAGAPRPGRVR